MQPFLLVVMARAYLLIVATTALFLLLFTWGLTVEPSPPKAAVSSAARARQLARAASKLPKYNFNSSTASSVLRDGYSSRMARLLRIAKYPAPSKAKDLNKAVATFLEHVDDWPEGGFLKE